MKNSILPILFISWIVYWGFSEVSGDEIIYQPKQFTQEEETWKVEIGRIPSTLNSSDTTSKSFFFNDRD